MTWRSVQTDKSTSMGDHRRFPGCRLLLTCTQCGWSKGYDPEKVIDRLHEQRAGGYRTQIVKIARRARPCPSCRSLAWQADFASPADVQASEIKRLANLYRN